MAHELFSLWGAQIGWRSQRGDGCDVTAELDGVDVWYQDKDVKTVAPQTASLSHYYMRRFRCGAPTSEFVLALQGDAPMGSTIQGVVVLGALP